ncbi:hypothetical protein FGG08_005084 [Glutinoglossum americanum]|uniref:Methyltransferase domain-containing protein n=1 Tax=Glutinoglossum americanum TaxID=1670608 RepID=A0A9P8I4B3_9PEZI|nr:hypothetical protein FGG08_005084 [Glutinoglossum americanum]
MDGQYLSHSTSYAFGSEEWPEFYDLWVESLFGPGPSEDASVFRSALERYAAGHNSGQPINVVDIGTGTGRVIKDLWQEPGGALENVAFWGLDNAQAMLDRAKSTFDALEASRRTDPAHHGQSSSLVRLPPTWIQAPAADFASSLPNLAGNADLIVFAVGGVGHLTADDEVERFLEQVRRALRPPGSYEPARAIISVLHEMIPEKNPDLAVEREQSNPEHSSDNVTDKPDSIIPSRDHLGITYVKLPTVSRWSSHDVRTDSFSITIIKDTEAGRYQEGEVLKKKEMAWSLRVFDEKAWNDAVKQAGLRIEEVKEGEIQRWYFLVPSGD